MCDISVWFTTAAVFDDAQRCIDPFSSRDFSQRHCQSIADVASFHGLSRASRNLKSEIGIRKKHGTHPKYNQYNYVVLFVKQPRAAGVQLVEGQVQISRQLSIIAKPR